MVSWQDEEAQLRGVFRDVNEQIDRMGTVFQIEGRRSFICECGNASCMTTIEIPLEEYEDVRGHGRRFLIAPDHENPEVEIVVSRRPGYAVTETFIGDASRIAEDTYPRAEADVN